MKAINMRMNSIHEKTIMIDSCTDIYHCASSTSAKPQADAVALTESS